MDALFGLPRKKAAGISYRDPLHDQFFCQQPLVDEFVKGAERNKATSEIGVSLLVGQYYNNYDFPGMQQFFGWQYASKLQAVSCTG